jgi:endonuclease YncB( thermonuclease family)
MRHFVFLILFLICRLTEARAAEFFGTVHEVCDGDTVVVFVQGRGFLELDLVGIDAPELGQPFGDDAKNFLAALVQKKLLRISTVETTRRETRVWLIMNTDNQLLNLQMIQEGYAWYDFQQLNDVQLRFAELKARRSLKGLWNDPKPTPPWEWTAVASTVTKPTQPVPTVSPLMRLKPVITEDELNSPSMPESFRKFYSEQLQAQKAQNDIMNAAKAEKFATEFFATASKLSVEDLHKFIADHPEIVLSQKYAAIESYVAIRERAEQKKP